jgi:branched-chain amino acid transport system ATP-binding protein
LEVVAGELLVIIGPNGAGKTTLFNLLSGLTRPTGGRITFAGRDVTHAPPYERARLGLGRTFQSSSIFAGLSVLENAYIGALAARTGAPRERARAALERVGLAARAEALASSLSHGEKRKLDLAILLCGDPTVVLLDEPTAGLAVEDVPELMGIIRAVHAQERKTVLMVEHRMDLVVEIADRMAVMHHGALLAHDVPERIMADPTVQAAYLGDPL